MKQTRQHLTETANRLTSAQQMLMAIPMQQRDVDPNAIVAMRKKLEQAEALVDEVRKQLFDME
jgi:hypothetical protein